MKTKVCNRCGIEKDCREFYYNFKRGVFRNTCKECKKEQQKQWLEDNEEYVKKYRKEQWQIKKKENERMKKVKEHNLRILINRYSKLTKQD